MQQFSENIKEKYSSQYENMDSHWRFIGGKQKSSNILKLCKGLNLTKVVDVGSGDGSVIDFLDKANFCKELYSIEISESGIEKINQRNLKTLKEVKLFDGYHIPYDDKTFNLSLCSHVVEHVEHPRTLLREIARVSEYQFFEIPIDFSFFVDTKIKHYLDYGHINIYTPSLFKFLLKSEGFEIVAEDFLFTNDEIIKFQFRNSQYKYWKQKIKNFLVSITPYKKIKPSAYAVLCKHKGTSLQIF
jgi:ubiquinone/menaquinone biosynthesis C-methylase UbiE